MEKKIEQKKLDNSEKSNYIDSFQSDMQIEREICRLAQQYGKDSTLQKQSIQELFEISYAYILARTVEAVPFEKIRDCVIEIYTTYLGHLNIEKNQSHSKSALFFQDISEGIQKYQSTKKSQTLNWEQWKPYVKEIKKASLLLDQILSTISEEWSYETTLYYVQKLDIEGIASQTHNTKENVLDKLNSGRKQIQRCLKTQGILIPDINYFIWLVEAENIDDVLKTIEARVKIEEGRNISDIKLRFRKILENANLEDDIEEESVFFSKPPRKSALKTIEEPKKSKIIEEETPKENIEEEIFNKESSIKESSIKKENPIEEKDSEKGFIEESNIEKLPIEKENFMSIKEEIIEESFIEENDIEETETSLDEDMEELFIYNETENITEKMSTSIIITFILIGMIILMIMVYFFFLW